MEKEGKEGSAMANLGWIKTNWRMPLDYKRVLVCYDNGWVEGAYHFSEGDGGWITDSGNKTSEKFINYWMPLPELPERG